MRFSPAAICAISAALSMTVSMPAQAQYMGDTAASPGAGAHQTNSKEIQDWFAKYDNVRRQAQMNPAERARADGMMSKGLSVIMPGAEKTEMQAFLTKLVARNNNAANELKGLPLYKETEQLHRGYYKYFTTARDLFNDYIKVQDNLFAVDASGSPIAKNLVVRKQELEQIDQMNKALDAQLRQKFGIAPYHYP